MTEEKKLGDFCWVCLKNGKETPSTGRKYGYPVCIDHDNNDLDPEEMEEFVIDLFRGTDEVQS
jgi:hypothetical protein